MILPQIELYVELTDLRSYLFQAKEIFNAVRNKHKLSTRGQDNQKAIHSLQVAEIYERMTHKSKQELQYMPLRPCHQICLQSPILQLLYFSLLKILIYTNTRTMYTGQNNDAVHSPYQEVHQALRHIKMMTSAQFHCQEKRKSSLF